MATKIQSFIGALTQDETAELAKRALATLENTTAIDVVVNWAAGENLIDEVIESLQDWEDGEDEEEEVEEEEDETA